MAADSRTIAATTRAQGRRRWRPILVSLLAIALAATVWTLIETGRRDTERLRQEHFDFFKRVEQQGGKVGFHQDSNLLTKSSDWLRTKVGWGLPGVRPKQYLGSLILMGPEITDADMRLLADLRRLESLEFYETRVSDDGLRPLRDLKGLTRLVFDPQITDAGLEHLSDLGHLTTLDLINTRVRGEGLSHLSGLSRLKDLYLTSTPLGDRGLQEIAAMRSLEKLYLNYTQISDAGLRHLSGLKDLTVLCLSGTRISDAGLEHLTGLTNMERLELDGTEVSDAGVRTLQAALPNARISR